MKALILAAGFATRLYPLTRTVAKPLLEVGGKPVISRLVARLSKIDNLDEILVVTNGRFYEDFARWRDALDGEIFIRLICNGAGDESEMRGGVADMALALQGVEDDVLVVGGDNLITFDLVDEAREFMNMSLPTIFVRRLEGEIPKRTYGEVTTDSKARIVRFREKPDRPESPLAATCIYYLPRRVVALVGEYIANGGQRDAPGHFIAWLANREEVRALEIKGTLFDIGSMESLETARREFS